MGSDFFEAVMKIPNDKSKWQIKALSFDKDSVTLQITSPTGLVEKQPFVLTLDNSLLLDYGIKIPQIDPKGDKSIEELKKVFPAYDSNTWEKCPVCGCNTMKRKYEPKDVLECAEPLCKKIFSVKSLEYMLESDGIGIIKRFITYDQEAYRQRLMRRLRSSVKVELELQELE